MIEIREKLINASTGDVRPGNLLPVKLGDDVEDLVIDGDTVEVKYYYVQTPDGTWRKTEFYEILSSILTITYKVDNDIYHVYYLHEGDIVPVPEDYVSEGYEWSGWLEQIPSVMPNENVIINSSTTAIIYNLSYYIDGKQILIEPHYAGESLTLYVPDEKPGYRFSGWSEDLWRMPASDKSLTGTYIENDTYYITYKLVNDGYYRIYSTVYYKYNDIIVSLVPELENYETFLGWIDEPERMPEEDIIVVGEVEYKEYSLSLYVDGDFWKTVTYHYDEPITEYYTPSPGYVFNGWYDMPQGGWMPAYDISLHGTTSLISYKITFMYDDESIYGEYYFHYGDTISLNPEPNREGYTFTGWSPVIPETMPAEDIVINAQFTKNQYTITFVTKRTGFSDLIDTVTLYYGDPITSALYPSSGNIYQEWHTELQVPETMPARNITLIGQFKTKEQTAYLYVDDELWQTFPFSVGYRLYPENLPVYTAAENKTWLGWSLALFYNNRTAMYWWPNAGDTSIYSYTVSDSIKPIKVILNSYWIRSTKTEHYNDPDWIYFALDTTSLNSLLSDPEYKHKTFYAPIRIELNKKMSSVKLKYGSTQWFKLLVDNSGYGTNVFGLPVDVQVPDYEYTDPENESEYVNLDDETRALNYEYISEFDNYVFPEDLSKLSNVRDGDTTPHRVVEIQLPLDDENHFMYIIGTRYLSPEQSGSKYIYLPSEPYDGAFIAFPKDLVELDGNMFYTVNWVIENVIVYSELLRYGSDITAPDIQIELRQGFTFAWNITESTVPFRDVNVYGYYTVINEYNTVNWYLDSSLYYSGQYRYNTTVTSPESPDYAHVYVWDENVFTMPAYDKNVYGHTEEREIADDCTGVPFGVAVYEHNIPNNFDLTLYPNVPDWCFIPLMRCQITGASSIDFYDSNDTKLATINPTIRLQYSDNGTTWNTINDYIVDFNSEKSNFDMSVSKMSPREEPLVNFKFIRLNIVDFGDTSSITSSIINNTAYYKAGDLTSTITDTIRTWVTSDDDPEVPWDVYIDVYDTLQLFGEFDSFYEHIVDQLNTQFGTNINIRGITVNASAYLMPQHINLLGVLYSHNAIERNVYNRIKSDFAYLSERTIYGPWARSWTLITAPQCMVTNLYPECYKNRWANYNRLKYGPSTLPATTLSPGCYQGMFSGCVSLLSGPSLPAATVSSHAYDSMFSGCVSIINPPDINGNVFEDSACASMFSGCSSLRRKADITVTDASTNAFDDMYSDTPVE